MRKAIGYYKQGMCNYTVFSGRANRPQFWYFILIYSLIPILFSIIGTLFGITISTIERVNTFYYWATLLPTMAITVRRLHDTGNKSWYSLVLLLGRYIDWLKKVVPSHYYEEYRDAYVLILITLLIWLIWLLVLLVKKGDSEANKYGDPPLKEPRGPGSTLEEPPEVMR